MGRAANGSARVFRPFFEISRISVTPPHTLEWSIERPSTNSATSFLVSAVKANWSDSQRCVSGNGLSDPPRIHCLHTHDGDLMKTSVVLDYHLAVGRVGY